MGTRLDQIVAAARRRVAEAKRSADLRRLEARAQEHKPRGFRRSLASRGERGIAIIAELKKASPSRGLIRPDFDPEQLARDFESAGAVALSVLTDEQFFQGSLANLCSASSATRLPCLRKDFIVDEFQLLEARAHGADAILLIAAALSQQELVALKQACGALELDVLCETHSADEVRRAVDAECDLIGVNNRDLRTFHVDVQTSYRLAGAIPDGAVRVAESGFSSGADLARLRAAGYHAFLVGESLMKSELPGEALRTLLAEAEAHVSSVQSSA